MRICVFGAGAGGGHIAARLAGAGHEVSVVARGEHLDAIRENGLRLVSGGEEILARVEASSDPAALGPQDLVLVAVKTTALRVVADGISPLLGAGTLVVFAQNGIQWWYPLGGEEKRKGRALPDLPVFRLAAPFLRHLSPQQVVGALVYTANEVRSPGVVVNTSPGFNRLLVAPAVDLEGDPCAPLRRALEGACIEAPQADDIRLEMWRKLLFNMSGSVLALATGNRSSMTRRDPELAETFRRLVAEGLAICDAYGYPLAGEMAPEAMLDKLLDHKPSLLQDYERRRPMEVAEIVLAPLAMARAAGVPAPRLQTAAAIVARLARDRGLLPDHELTDARP